MCVQSTNTESQYCNVQTVNALKLQPTTNPLGKNEPRSLTSCPLYVLYYLLQSLRSPYLDNKTYLGSYTLIRNFGQIVEVNDPNIYRT